MINLYIYINNFEKVQIVIHKYSWHINIVNKNKTNIMDESYFLLNKDDNIHKSEAMKQ